MLLLPLLLLQSCCARLPAQAEELLILLLQQYMMLMPLMLHVQVEELLMLPLQPYANGSEAASRRWVRQDFRMRRRLFLEEVRARVEGGRYRQSGRSLVPARQRS